MKNNLIISPFVAAIFIFLKVIMIIPVDAGGSELIRAEPAAIYQSWNWNYGEPGHDPDWVIRGRRNRDDERDSGGGNGGKGEENGNGPGVSFPDQDGEEMPEIFLMYYEETNSPASRYLRFLKLLGEYLLTEK